MMDEGKKHCKWYKDEVCVNGDSPCVDDYCPVVEYPELCKHREVEEYELCDKDIAKAFKVCNTIGMSCKECPFEKDGEECSGVEQLTANLLERLFGEIDELKEERENMQAVIFGLEEEKRQLQKENSKVISFNDTLYREKQQAVKDTLNKVFNICDEEYYKDGGLFTLRVRNRIETECGVEVE